MMRKFLNEIKGISIVDIGSSGRLAPKWKRLERYINLTGFDPNKAECKRMSKALHLFLSARYLPYAIVGVNGRANLYKTKNIYCWSLLRPNLEWLRRFSYSELFEIKK